MSHMEITDLHAKLHHRGAWYDCGLCRVVDDASRAGTFKVDTTPLVIGKDMRRELIGDLRLIAAEVKAGKNLGDAAADLTAMADRLER